MRCHPSDPANRSHVQGQASLQPAPDGGGARGAAEGIRADIVVEAQQRQVLSGGRRGGERIVRVGYIGQVVHVVVQVHGRRVNVLRGTAALSFGAGPADAAAWTEASSRPGVAQGTAEHAHTITFNCLYKVKPRTGSRAL